MWPCCSWVVHIAVNHVHLSCIYVNQPTSTWIAVIQKTKICIWKYGILFMLFFFTVSVFCCLFTVSQYFGRMKAQSLFQDCPKCQRIHIWLVYWVDGFWGLLCVLNLLLSIEIKRPHNLCVFHTGFSWVNPGLFRVLNAVCKEHSRNIHITIVYILLG